MNLILIYNNKNFTLSRANTTERNGSFYISGIWDNEFPFNDLTEQVQPMTVLYNSRIIATSAWLIRAESYQPRLVELKGIKSL